ncbi:MAG: peptidylprolyl isomerase [Alphaproteobacteria bacterium]
MKTQLHWATRTAALGMTLAVLTAPALAADADPVVAKFSGKQILRSEVMKQIEGLGPQAQQMPLQMVFPQVLDRMVATRLVAAAGYAKGYEDNAEVKERLKSVKDELVAQAYVKQTVEPQATEDKIKARYDEMVKQFKPQDEVRARHILVKTDAEAKDVIKQLKGGADFAKLAMDKSKDTGSAKQGGDLGYFPKTEMVKEFAEAAFALKTGETSAAPVKTSFGYHVIKAEDRRKSAPPALDDAIRGQIKNQVASELAQKLVGDLVKDAKVERFNPDGTPMVPADATAKKDK